MQTDMMGTVVIPRQPLPVGFRFQPTDKEVFDHYLKRRNTGLKFSADVPDIEMTKLDPWELLVQIKDKLSYQANDNDWWCFSPRIRNQKPTRMTGSGKWGSTCSDKIIMDEDKNQIMGIMTSFVFHCRQGQGQYKRSAKWKLYEYRLTDDCLDGLPLPDDTFFALCHLSNKHDETKNKTGMKVPQTYGEISSHKCQRKRTMESMEAPFGSVDLDFTFAYLEQQRHRQDNFLSSYQMQSSENPYNVQQSVESFGNNSSAVEQWQTEMLIQNLIAAEPPQVLPHESLLHQGGLFEDTSSSSRQNIHILGNRRTQSAKSLRVVVPVEEKKTVVENRIARPQPSPLLSPIIVEEPKGSKASNSPSSFELFIKLEARVVKKEPTAANPHSEEIGVAKIEEDEELAQETTEKLRLTAGPS